MLLVQNFSLIRMVKLPETPDSNVKTNTKASSVSEVFVIHVLHSESNSTPHFFGNELHKKKGNYRRRQRATFGEYEFLIRSQGSRIGVGV